MQIDFYHLERRPLDNVLPTLLEKTIARQIKAVVKLGSDERLKWLDEHLWTYRDESFLPHGTDADGKSDVQPIYLTTADRRPNDAPYLFVVDGAAPPSDQAGIERMLIVFDGNDPDQLDAARGHWKNFKTQGHTLSYWQQSEQGRWENKASG
jgi:DNA polymerase III subunit chi